MNLPPAPFPAYRPRRLRQSAALRRLVSETQLNISQLVLPFFARSGRRLRQPVGAMPGVFQLSPDEVLRDAAKAFELGVPAVMLFGIPDKKDDPRDVGLEESLSREERSRSLSKIDESSSRGEIVLPLAFPAGLPAIHHWYLPGSKRASPRDT